MFLYFRYTLCIWKGSVTLKKNFLIILQYYKTFHFISIDTIILPNSGVKITSVGIKNIKILSVHAYLLFYTEILFKKDSLVTTITTPINLIA